MRRTSAFAVALAMTLAATVAQGQFPASQGILPSPGAASPQTGPPRIATRSTSFVMEFSVEQMEAAVVEVQLYVSTNQGAKWELADRQLPAAGRFVFRAPGDGEYWFASRTLDARGRSFPDGPLRPEQSVIVDTTRPRLEFAVSVGSAGEVQAEWQAFDINLDPKTLRIEYQTGPGQIWKPVAIELPSEGGERHHVSGRTSWFVPEVGVTLSVRAEVRDRAENAEAIVRQLTLPRTARRDGEDRATTSPPQDPNAWRPPPSVGATAWPSDNLPLVGNAAGSGGDSRFGAPAIAGGPASASGPAPAPEDSFAIPVPGFRTVDASGAPRPLPAQRASQTRPAPAGDIASLPPQHPVPDQVRPGVADRATANPAAPQAYPAVTLPPGVKPEMTNAKRFNLDYDVTSVGPNGVADVELWATTDGGRRWDRWGKDPDRTSPFDVKVERDGIYGFRVVVVGQSGLASQPPRPGDLADIWVGIDSTPPRTKLLSATYGEGASAGQLMIRWQAYDERLVERPVTLAFSDRPEGSWTAIAAGLPNSGQYNWPADPRLPEKIYLRIEVRDQAGNVGVDQLSEPIDVQGLTPRGRIRGFRPNAAEARDASVPRRLQ